MDELGLKGKVAVVTGSSRGWGLGMAKELGKRGVRVVVNGTRADDVVRASEEVRALGTESVPVVESVESREGAARIVASAVETFGQLDIMINNAGTLRSGTVLEMTEQEWDKVIGVQLKGVFNGTQAAARQMVAQGRGGRIINIAGGRATRGMYANANHAASKAGVIAATMSWALELWPYGITVNAARATVQSATSGPIIGQVRAELARLGTPERELSDRDLGFFEPGESSAAVVWLASEKCAHISGQFIGLDGPRLTIWGLWNPERDAYHFPNWSPELLDEMAVGDLMAAGPANMLSIDRRDDQELRKELQRNGGGNGRNYDPASFGFAQARARTVHHRVAGKAETAEPSRPR